MAAGSTGQSMNIGFFAIDYSAGGGVERVTANLMKQFSALGYNQLHLFSLQPSADVPAMDFPAVKSLNVFDRKAADFPTAFADKLRQENIQHLIFQGDNMSIALQVLKACKLASCQGYLQYHGSPFAYLKKYADAEHSNNAKIFFSRLQYPFKLKKLRRVVQAATSGIYCVSNGAANELKNLLPSGRDRDRIKVIHNPIEIPANAPALKTKTVVLVSRLESRHKNAFLAMKAWAEIHSRFPEWKLRIIGDGNLKETMIEFASSENIQNVEFTGFTSDVDAILAESSVALNVSNCEGFSMALAEAMVLKNAVAATDSDGGAKDMIKNGITALISPKNDAGKLAENLSRLVSDEALRSRLSEAGYAQVLSLADSSAAQHWLSVFAEHSVP